jgi:hypothetical protein
MYNKKLNFYLIFMFLLNSQFAIGQHSINTAGNNATGNGGTVNYSIGQVFYHHLNDDNYTLDEGVQYGYEITNSIGENSNVYLSHFVYPNPTKSNFTLSISEFKSGLFSYILYNINGSIINRLEIIDPLSAISLSKFDGNSFILTVFKNNELIKSFTIIKN